MGTMSIRHTPYVTLDPEAQRLIDAELGAWDAVRGLRQRIAALQTVLARKEALLEQSTRAVDAHDYPYACESCDTHRFTARIPTNGYGVLRLCGPCSGHPDEEEFRQLYDDEGEVMEPSRPELELRGLLVESGATA